MTDEELELFQRFRHEAEQLGWILQHADEKDGVWTIPHSPLGQEFGSAPYASGATLAEAAQKAIQHIEDISG